MQMSLVLTFPAGLCEPTVVTQANFDELPSSVAPSYDPSVWLRLGPILGIKISRYLPSSVIFFTMSNIEQLLGHVRAFILKRNARRAAVAAEATLVAF